MSAEGRSWGRDEVEVLSLESVDSTETCEEGSTEEPLCTKCELKEARGCKGVD